MKLSYEAYRDKVMGCWAGKNIGGVLGAPFEGRRRMNDVSFYTQDLSAGPPPNDDLDLQIVWLTAAERYGRHVNASILGEYWLSYVTPNWVEYGTGKANLVNGLVPPMSGHFLNQYRNSCGCFIRSEIWACLAPGQPDIAVRYAYEDAIVDHSGEGAFGEIFCAALESAAFAESDARKLIDIGLSYIPAECAVARCVKKAVESYDAGLCLAEARLKIHSEAPGTFGVQGRTVADSAAEGMEVGAPGFDAPENIGFLIAGWLYGEGDFGKSVCAAVNCGEDTDCTGATLGSILGIVGGASALPEKWTAPLDDKIATMCINMTSWGGVWVPKTVTELTDRVLRVTPLFLGIHDCDILGGYAVNCKEGAALYCPKEDYLPRMNAAGGPPRELSVGELTALSPYVARFAFPTHTVLVDYGDGIFFTSDEPRRFKVTVINNNTMLQQMWCEMKLYLPAGAKPAGGAEFSMQLNTLFGDRAETVFCVDASEYGGSRLEVIVDISLAGRHTDTPVKAVFLRRPREA
ncbi:MAG: ADP-ribosylglycohydrolase family protein [Firmicutes bacterium]|nr:ADP-ribosylglycohydrolase family protein [Bacillota bacterium]